MRRAARKDVIHQPIVQGLKSYGVVVFDMPDPGDVLCFKDPIWMPMEFKSPDSVRKQAKQLTKAQEKRAQQKQIPIVESLDQALSLLGIAK